MNKLLAKINRLPKTWIIFGVALLVGILAAWAAKSYLSQRLKELEDRAKGQTANVIVAKKDLLKGAILSIDNLAIRPIPLDYVHSQAVRPEMFDRINGESLGYNIKSGEPILWGLMEKKKVPTFSAALGKGQRAITVPVDEINSISGLLEPGDFIDLVVTLNQKDKKFTIPLLQDVQVIATGQRTVSDPKSGERRTFSTVTLNTDPRQAQAVIVAREAGKVTALLRNPEDKGRLPWTNGDFAELMGLNASDMPDAAFREIPVLYGGRGGKIPSEGMHLGQYVNAAPKKGKGEALSQDDFQSRGLLAGSVSDAIDQAASQSSTTATIGGGSMKPLSSGSTSSIDQAAPQSSVTSIIGGGSTKPPSSGSTSSISQPEGSR